MTTMTTVMIVIVRASVFVAVIGLLEIVTCTDDTTVTPQDGPETITPSAREMLQTNRKRSCTYEGLVYTEGQQVVIKGEPCLNCSCRQGSLVCYLRVCPHLPDPPPPECVLVHRKHHCCPHITCRDGSPSKQKFDGRSDIMLGANIIAGKDCVANGTVYAEGSAMHSSGLCDYCYCIRGRQQCVQPRCLLPLEGCVPGYRTLSCCPTHYNCSQAIAAETTTTSVAPTNFIGCDVNGKFYPEGEMVKAVAISKCENCFCLKGKVHCMALECAPPLLGCSPVITPGKCCPTRYNCSGVSDLELSDDGFPATLDTGNSNYLELYPDSKSPSSTITKRKQVSSVRSMVTSLIKSKMHYQQVVSEGRSNHDDTGWIRNTTSAEINGTSTETAAPTTETTTEEATTETTTIASTITTTDITTIRTTQPPTTIMMTTLEALSENNKTDDIQERNGEVHTDNSTNDDQVTIDTTTQNDDEDIMTVQTETTFMTSLPTTIIMPEDLYVANITVHSNVTIVEKDDNVTAVNGSLPPVRAISPEIEAYLNNTRKKDNDYEYDYNEPSLPPSLPNLKIIPFLVEDAVRDEDDDIERPIGYPTQDKHRPTDNPLYYKVSHPNRFSPPIETEGGFVPREPILDGPFYESKYEVPYHTTVLNIPDARIPVDITVGTILPPSITMLPKTSEHCLSDGREYQHGELISEPSACITCRCYYGEVLCQEGKCPHVKTGCRRLKEKEHGVCCGRVICDDGESPTVVLVDRIDITPNPLQTMQQQGPPHHLGGIVPPITVADGVVTPDPFRDVIRTEPAPDLPSLIEDMMPYLLERHTGSSTTPTSTSNPSSNLKITLSTMKPTTSSKSVTTSTKKEAVALPVAASRLPPLSNISTPATSQVLRENSDVEDGTSGDILEEKILNDSSDELNKDEESETNGLSIDSVLQFLFSGIDSTRPPPRTTSTARHPESSSVSQLSSKPSKDSSTTSHNSIAFSSSNQSLLEINKSNNRKHSENTTVKANTTLKNEDAFSLTTESDVSNTRYTTAQPLVLTTGLNSVNSTSSDTLSNREPPPGRPPNLDGPSAPVSADSGVASGLLKLAGCNIYGRMYRVGRIISELSGPCLECMCTEVGVQCRPLDC